VTLAAVIFDCDGLLVDSETAWTRAERVLYARRGVEFTEDHKRELVGTAGPIARAIFERHIGGTVDGEALENELRLLVVEEIGRSAPAMPGALALVDALATAGVPLGVASNSPRNLVDLSLRVSGLEGRFGAIVVAEDVPKSKPAPDVYLAAARALGAEPSASVALEDSPTGVAAAHAAAMFVIGVPSMHGVDLSLADLVAPSLAAPEVADALGLRLAA
jgi:HAD superfamily hydrolase (TIGR01509 family)